MGKKPYHDWEIKHALLNNKCINGFQYWNYMRRDMLISFGDEYADIDPPFYRNMKEGSKGGKFKDLKKVLDLIVPDGGDRVKRSDILFICHGRRLEIDGKQVSIYTDFIEERFPDSITLQRSGMGKGYRDSVKTGHIIFIEKLTTKSYIYRYIKKYINPGEYKRIREKVLSDMHEAFTDLKENYSLHVNEQDFAERAATLYYYYTYKKPRLEKLLRKISPKVIVEVVGKSFDAKIINEIAYESGIETVELQHGNNSSWYPDNTVVAQIPGWYYSFGDFWSRAVHLPIPEDHVRSMGFPYHDMEMREYPREKWEHDGNTAVFLSSRKYGKEFAALALKLKELIPDIHIIFKLHPRECADYEERYLSLDENGIEVIKDNKVPLYSLFSRSSIQVGVESTAIYEGMSFMLRTFIWDIPMAGNMKNLAEYGYASLFKDAEELAGLIKNSNDKDAGYDINDFWKENSLENIISGIKELAGEK